MILDGYRDPALAKKLRVEIERLAHAIRPDQPNHAAGRKLQGDGVQSERLAVALRDRIQARGHATVGDHRGALACSCAGQATAGSVRT